MKATSIYEGIKKAESNRYETILFSKRAENLPIEDDSFWYKFNEKYWVITKEPINGYIPQAIAPKTPISYKDKSLWLYFQAEGFVFLRKPETQTEMIVFKNYHNPKRTGWVSRGKRVHVNPLEFREILEKEKNNTKQMFWTFHVHMGNDGHYIELYRESKFRLCSLKEIRNLKDYYKTVDVAKNCEFELPYKFCQECGINGNEFLKVEHIDNKIVFIAPDVLCSCCGKPIKQYGENTSELLACRVCSDALNGIKPILQKHNTDADKFLSTLNQLKKDKKQAEELYCRLKGVK